MLPGKSGPRGFCRTEATEITYKRSVTEASDRQNPEARYARKKLEKPQPRINPIRGAKMQNVQRFAQPQRLRATPTLKIRT